MDVSVLMNSTEHDVLIGKGITYINITSLNKHIQRNYTLLLKMFYFLQKSIMVLTYIKPYKSRDKLRKFNLRIPITNKVNVVRSDSYNGSANSPELPHVLSSSTEPDFFTEKGIFTYVFSLYRYINF